MNFYTLLHGTLSDSHAFRSNVQHRMVELEDWKMNDIEVGTDGRDRKGMVYSSWCKFLTLYLPIRFRFRLHMSLIPSPHVIPQRIQPNRVLRHLTNIPLILLRQPLHRRPTHTPNASFPSTLRVLQFIREAVLIFYALLRDVDFVLYEDGGERLLEHGPEDGHRGAHDCEVDFEAGEDDHEGRVPREVVIWICASAVAGNGLETPDGCCDDTGVKSV